MKKLLLAGLSTLILLPGIVLGTQNVATTQAATQTSTMNNQTADNTSSTSATTTDSADQCHLMYLAGGAVMGRATID